MMRYLSDTFWRCPWGVCTLLQSKCEFCVGLSVCKLANFLTEIRQIYGYLQFWMRYISDTFWRDSWGVGTLVPNKGDFFICLISLLVVLLPY